MRVFGCAKAAKRSRPVAGFSNAWEAVTLRLSAVDPSILVGAPGVGRAWGMSHALRMVEIDLSG